MLPQDCHINSSYQRIVLKENFIVLVFQDEWYFVKHLSAQVRLLPKYNPTSQSKIWEPETCKCGNLEVNKVIGVFLNLKAFNGGACLAGTEWY